MRALCTIAYREWRSMFLSPLAWTLLAVLFAIAAYMFNAAVINYQLRLMQFQSYGGMGGGGEISLTEWTVAPMLGNAAVLMLLLMPLLTMRLIAEEKRQDTWPALASSPLSPMTIIGGKYLGLLLFLLVTVAMLGIMPLTLYFFGSPDTGQIVAGLLGLFLVTAAFGAIGLAASSATDSPIVAAFITFGVLLSLWIVAWMGDSAGSEVGKILTWVSLLNHYENFLTGVISSADLAYFLLLSSFGLVFARQRMVAERIRG
ncbi:MAG: hypothetical protein H7832_15315 [Magnetococcus sp. DMHC-6]